jgi:hypothetical protein
MVYGRLTAGLKKAKKNNYAQSQERRVGSQIRVKHRQVWYDMQPRGSSGKLVLVFVRVEAVQYCRNQTKQKNI